MIKAVEAPLKHDLTRLFTNTVLAISRVGYREYDSLLTTFTRSILWNEMVTISS